jgi:hypothetical protein
MGATRFYERKALGMDFCHVGARFSIPSGRPGTYLSGTLRYGCRGSRGGVSLSMGALWREPGEGPLAGDS